MPIPIQAIRPPAQIDSIQLDAGQKSSAPAGVFQSVLDQAIGGFQKAQSSANGIVDQFLSGENVEIHQVAMETQKAELAFDMFMAARNKVVSAYQEVMRMQM